MPDKCIPGPNSDVMQGGLIGLRNPLTECSDSVQYSMHNPLTECTDSCLLSTGWCLGSNITAMNKPTSEHDLIIQEYPYNRREDVIRAHCPADHTDMLSVNR